MNRSRWAWARVLAGFAILGAIGWRVGTGAFLTGVRAVDLRSIGLAVLITVATTTACAWRWQVVARGVGAGMTLSRAIAAYYRSQFLNTVLPGGILGDVHRGVDHGRTAGDLGRGLRAVAWERVAGQIVQVALAVVVLVVLPSPVRSALPLLVGAVVALVLAMAVAVRSAPRISASRWARAWRAAASDVRHGLLARRAWPVITAGSLVAVAGHASVFLIAARAAGVHANVRVLLPLALFVLVAATVPTNVGGWGPREGAAAWAFAAAGQGATHGVATATAFGVLMVLATLPGAVVLIVVRWHRERPAADPAFVASPHALVGARNG